MKIAGIIILVLMSASAGCMAANGLKSRLLALRQLRTMLDEIRLMVRYEAVPVDEMISRLYRSGIYDRIEFLAPLCERITEYDQTDADKSFSAMWQYGVSQNKGAFSDEDTAMLLSLGNVLGTTDCEGQLSAIAHAEEETVRLISQAEEMYHAKGRLYRSLGAIAGALAAVIIV